MPSDHAPSRASADHYGNGTTTNVLGLGANMNLLIVGAIDKTTFVPDTPQAVQGKTEGFTLSISVQGKGKQCVNVTCDPSLPPREQVALVIE